MGGTGVTDVAPGGFLDIDSSVGAAFSAYSGLRTVNNAGTNISTDVDTFLSTDNTFAVLANYLESAFANIASQVSDEIGSNPVPLLGSQDASTYMSQVIGSFDSALAGAIGGTGIHLAAIREAIFQALGPSGLNLLADLNADGVIDESDIEMTDYQGSVFVTLGLH
ncbi:MAG: hypothetical protein ACLQVF_18055 [Isosphaeraceae bacterium]